MKISNEFKIEIKPYEWLLLIAGGVIIILLAHGDRQAAIDLLLRLLPKNH